MNTTSTFVNTNPELARSYFVRSNMFKGVKKKSSAQMTLYIHEGLFDPSKNGEVYAFSNTMTGQSYSLCAAYPFILKVIDGYYIPLSARELESGYSLPGGMALNLQIVAAKAQKVQGRPMRKMTVVQSLHNCSEVFAACFVPKKYMFPWDVTTGLAVNDRRVKSHGHGDFLVGPVRAGVVDGNGVQLINGLVFAHMFDCHRFTDKVLQELQQQATKVLG